MVRKGMVVWGWSEFRNGRLVEADGAWADVIRPWDRPGARRWSYPTGWRAVVPTSFHLGRMQQEIDRVKALPFRSRFSEERAAAYEAAIASIPEHVVRVVRPFRRSHLRLLWAARRGGEYFLQLLEDHPALALLVAERRRFGVTVPLADLVLMKRHHLLGVFGFPASRLWVRHLRRLDAGSLTPSLLKDLRPACFDDRVAYAFTYLPRLTPVVLAILRDARMMAWTTPAFRWETSLFGTLTFEQLGLARNGIDALGAQKPVPFTSTAELRERLGIASSYSDVLYDMRSNRPLTLQGLPPQEEGEVRILPIRTAGELLQESFLMHHCAANYLPDAMMGYRTFYTVHAEGLRATLCLRHHTSGRTRITDLRGPHNHRIPDRIWKAVREWLKNATSPALSDQPGDDEPRARQGS